MNTIKLLAAFLLFVNVIQAQTKNVFLEREFWKTNPSIEVIDQKITEGNSATVLNKNGFDAVVYAILENADNAIIKHLLSKKGNGVNKLTHDKRTYVFWAAYKGNLELVKHLINNNARLDLKDSHNFSPLTFAAVAGQTNTEIYDVFIKNGIDVKSDLDEKGANALLLLIGHLKDFELVDYFVGKGLNLDSIDNHGNGAFNYTAYKGNKTMLELLIKKGLPYKNPSANGDNAILAATIGSRSGYNPLSFIKYLEGLGINPNITNKDGITPLHNIAYGNKDLNTFNYFLDKGVNSNQKDDKGNTPLLNASHSNTLEVVKLLVKKTNDVNTTNKEGHSALTNAIKNNTIDVVDFLISQKADVNVIDSKGNNLVYYTLKSYNPNKVDQFKKKIVALTKKGFDIAKPQKNGNTLYHLAIEKNDLELLKMIPDYNIDINAKNKEGITVLHKAAMSAKNNKILTYLLSIGADKTIKTDFEESVFDLASENEVLKGNNVDLNFLK
ncbi:ankyrin repeat domain-containing protein [Aquimarina megaterium]|uniref:ankyrin repeat domain-containing protein n=1 Tax=Aquimarina megaterium TaxID=1443666 RepID=UPI0004702043|nr:ankyrin repeat domain-containing protein [Aquimarina megaterium]